MLLFSIELSNIFFLHTDEFHPCKKIDPKKSVVQGNIS